MYSGFAALFGVTLVLAGWAVYAFTCENDDEEAGAQSDRLATARTSAGSGAASAANSSKQSSKAKRSKRE